MKLIFTKKDGLYFLFLSSLYGKCEQLKLLLYKGK